MAGSTSLGIGSHLVGALSAGAALGLWALDYSGDYSGPVVGQPVTVAAFIPGLVVAGAAALGLIPVPGRLAWLVSAVGILGVYGLYAQGTWLDSQALPVLLGVCLALVLGGALRAYAGERSRGRLVIAGGLAAGLIGGETVLRAVADGDTAILLGLTGLAVLGGVGALVARVPDGPRTSRGSVLLLAVVGVGVGVLETARALILDAMSSTGELSDGGRVSVEVVAGITKALISVAVIVVLTVVGRRWTGASGARWVVVGFALAATTTFGLPIGAAAVAAAHPPSLVLIPVVVVAAGLALARRFDAVLPWDALGVAGMAIAVAVATTASFTDAGLGSAASAAIAIYALGLAPLALGAALGGLRRGRDGADPAVGLALGFSALMLGGQLGSDVAFSARLQDPLRWGVAAALLVGAVGLVLLFVRSRRSVITVELPQEAVAA